MASKLNRAEILAIRKMHAANTHTVREMAAMYRVGTETIRRVVRGDTWGENMMAERPYVGPSAEEKLLAQASEERFKRKMMEEGLDKLMIGEMPAPKALPESIPHAYGRAPADDTREALVAANKHIKEVTDNLTSDKAKAAVRELTGK